ncbi:zinc finger CCCH domain-containing protein 11 [Scenedesmus sp. PABB004]|nr:zinc finger CCCH domain-containing protein 11 [Scenedesmus sp. PABB004]
MAPKKVVDPDKAAKAKAKQKAAEDKTFGLKNKNKSAKVQKYVQGVASSNVGVSTKDKRAQEAAEKAKRDKKEAEERRKKELAELFATTIKQPKVPAGVDPKSVVCEFFRHGQCTKGFKCKYSHDLAVERKTAKIDLFTDQRELGKDGEEGMEDWDQATLEKVVAEKHGSEKPSNATSIICKFFLDAVEKRQYGWFWKCPNGSDCKYKHALPPGYVLKSQMKELLEEEAAKNSRDITEVIEEERAKVVAKTAITEEVFAGWHAKKRAEREARRTAALEERKKKGLLNGREIFLSDNFVATDDAAAGGADEYAREDDDEARINDMFEQARKAQQAAAEQAAAAPAADAAGAGPSSSAAAGGDGGAGGAAATALALDADDAALFDDSEELDDEDLDDEELEQLEQRLGKGAAVNEHAAMAQEFHVTCWVPKVPPTAAQQPAPWRPAGSNSLHSTGAGDAAATVRSSRLFRQLAGAPQQAARPPSPAAEQAPRDGPLRDSRIFKPRQHQHQPQQPQPSRRGRAAGAAAADKENAPLRSSRLFKAGVGVGGAPARAAPARTALGGLRAVQQDQQGRGGAWPSGGGVLQLLVPLGTPAGTPGTQLRYAAAAESSSTGSAAATASGSSASGGRAFGAARRPSPPSSHFVCTGSGAGGGGGASPGRKRREARQAREAAAAVQALLWQGQQLYQHQQQRAPTPRGPQASPAPAFAGGGDACLTPSSSGSNALRERGGSAWAPSTGGAASAWPSSSRQSPGSCGGSAWSGGASSAAAALREPAASDGLSVQDSGSSSSSSSSGEARWEPHAEALRAEAAGEAAASPCQLEGGQPPPQPPSQPSPQPPPSPPSPQRLAEGPAAAPQPLDDAAAPPSPAARNAASAAASYRALLCSAQALVTNSELAWLKLNNYHRQRISGPLPGSPLRTPARPLSRMGSAAKQPPAQEQPSAPLQTPSRAGLGVLQFSSPAPLGRLLGGGLGGIVLPGSPARTPGVRHSSPGVMLTCLTGASGLATQPAALRSARSSSLRGDGPGGAAGPWPSLQEPPTSPAGTVFLTPGAGAGSGASGGPAAASDDAPSRSPWWRAAAAAEQPAACAGRAGGGGADDGVVPRVLFGGLDGASPATARRPCPSPEAFPFGCGSAQAAQAAPAQQPRMRADAGGGVHGASPPSDSAAAQAPTDQECWSVHTNWAADGLDMQHPAAPPAPAARLGDGRGGATRPPLAPLGADRQRGDAAGEVLLAVVRGIENLSPADAALACERLAARAKAARGHGGGASRPALTSRADVGMVLPSPTGCGRWAGACGGGK